MAELIASNHGRARLQLALERDELTAVTVAIRAWRKTMGKAQPTVKECLAVSEACAHDAARMAAWQMVYHGDLSVDVNEHGQVEFWTIETPPRKVWVGPDPN